MNDFIYFLIGWGVLITIVGLWGFHRTNVLNRREQQRAMNGTEE